ncbi:MAG: hypothetical protein E7576_01085 [Ruminococcaceae bacterium]|nr:hypothetical protein [Oscillospiraceae bacterium]
MEFDKDSEAFGPIEQLTDDEWEDTDPRVVYDEGTKDYIVLYTKTAQDSKKYDTLDEKFIDNLNPYADPGSTYSVMCYMLYNGTQEDGEEAPVGGCAIICTITKTARSRALSRRPISSRNTADSASSQPRSMA